MPKTSKKNNLNQNINSYLNTFVNWRSNRGDFLALMKRLKKTSEKKIKKNLFLWRQQLVFLLFLVLLFLFKIYFIIKNAESCKKIFSNKNIFFIK